MWPVEKRESPPYGLMAGGSGHGHAPLSAPPPSFLRAAVRVTRNVIDCEREHDEPSRKYDEQRDTQHVQHDVPLVRWDDGGRGFARYPLPRASRLGHVTRRHAGVTLRLAARLAPRIEIERLAVLARLIRGRHGCD